MAEAAAIGAFYAVETALEGAAAYVLTKPTLPVKTKLTHLTTSTQPIPRSSHTLSIVNNKAYLFGGELEPRKPVSNAIEVLDLSSVSTDGSPIDHQTVPARSVHGDVGTAADDIPVARVGHSAAAARGRIFIFGGRGGPEMTALDEQGKLRIFDTLTQTWDALSPPPDTKFPQARSYHASCANADGSAIFVHAGCPSTGARLSDTWAWYLDSGKWTKLADAPAPGRGGTSICVAQNRLWRFGGFDGKGELGGCLDYLELGSSEGEAMKSGWQTVPFTFEGREAKSETVPANRSLAVLAPLNLGLGREYLLLALGEGDPSTQGHAGAGKFFQDVWAYELPAASVSGAGLKDAIRNRVPSMNSTTGQWSKVEIAEVAVGAEEKTGGQWTGRGWFGSAPLENGSGVVVWGGINMGNERLGDGWIVGSA